MSIIQGGGGFPFLSESVYKYFTDKMCLDIQVESKEIGDGTLRFVVSKVSFK